MVLRKSIDQTSVKSDHNNFDIQKSFMQFKKYTSE